MLQIARSALRALTIGRLRTVANSRHLDEYCTEVTSDVCCRHELMYGNSKNVIAMSQSAILLSVDPIRELTRKLNPAVLIIPEHPVEVLEQFAPIFKMWCSTSSKSTTSSTLPSTHPLSHSKSC